MTATSAELFHNGSWVRVPAVAAGGRTIVATGRWLRTAAIHDEECLEQPLERPDDIVGALRGGGRRGLKADLFSFAQHLPATAPIYAYPFEWESLAAIRLTTFDAWWTALPQVSRKNTRRAAKRGVEIRVQSLDADLVRQIVELNNESPTRQGRRFTHYGESAADVEKDFRSFSDRSDLLVAFHEGALVGVAKTVYCGPVAALMKLQPSLRHADKRPANALITRAVERAVERGSSYITYGRFRYGNQQTTSLLEFKMRNGFEEMRVPRYYVPLTLKGSLALTLGLHRPLSGLLPEPLLRLARHTRSRWHGADQTAAAAGGAELSDGAAS